MPKAMSRKPFSDDQWKQIKSGKASAGDIDEWMDPLTGEDEAEDSHNKNIKDKTASKQPKQSQDKKKQKTNPGKLA